MYALNLVQVAIHAIGDKANDMVLDIYESVISTNGPRDRRFRVMCSRIGNLINVLMNISHLYFLFLMSRLSMLNIWHLELLNDLVN